MKELKELKRNILIQYSWWRVDKKDIPRNHIEELDTSAILTIKRQMGKGYVSGDLVENLCITNKDPNKGIDYRGSWWTKTN